MSNPTPERVPPSYDRCAHPHTELRRRTDARGKNHYFLRCMICGVDAEPVPHSDPRVSGLHVLPPVKDETISQHYWHARFARHGAEATLRREERAEEYNAYLRSERWRQKRAKRLEIDRHRCTAMLDGCTGQATEVHHTTYEHCGDEPMFDLRSVCGSCHDRIHEIEAGIREARYGRAS